MSRIDPRDLREARANLEAYRHRFSMPDSAMHRSLGIALQCIDAELARAVEPQQLTIDDITKEK